MGRISRTFTDSVYARKYIPPDSTDNKKELLKFIPEDIVINSNPATDTQLERGAKVNLLISLGEYPISYVMPNLTGKRLREVQPWLDVLKLKIGEQTYKETNDIPSSIILETNPAPGSEITAGMYVNFIISQRVVSSNP